MKKEFLAGIIGSMLVSSVAMAAPVTDLAKGETSIGYNYSHLDFSVDSTPIDKSAGVDGFYVEHGLNDKFVLGVEHNSGDASQSFGVNTLKAEDKETDVYVQYKAQPNLKLILGSRKYDQSAYVNNAKLASYNKSKALYGIAFNTSLTEKVNGYTSVLGTSEETEWRIGATYQLDKQTNLDINYKDKDFDDSSLKGWGFGLNYKF